MRLKEYNIGIIGSGKMGRDLFDFLRGFPLPLTLICKTDEAVENLTIIFRKKQKRALKYQLITQADFDFRQQNTIITTSLKSLTNCNLVIETITEDLQKKRELFHQLSTQLTTDCVVASNTSSIPPDELFSGLQHEVNCLGLHFFFPVGMKDVSEINVTEKSSEKTVSFIKGFLKDIRKNTIVLQTENHFIINRIFLRMQAGCCQLVRDGKCSVAALDKLVKTHLFPIGIFEFFDQVGNDVILQSVRNYIKYEDNPAFYQVMIMLLEQKVKAGKLGVKLKSGFYEYPLKKSEPLQKENPEILQQIAQWYLDGVFEALQKLIGSKTQLEHIVSEYMAPEKSPFELAATMAYKPK